MAKSRTAPTKRSELTQQQMQYLEALLASYWGGGSFPDCRLIIERVGALLDGGEDTTDIMRRLNP